MFCSVTREAYDYESRKETTIISSTRSFDYIFGKLGSSCRYSCCFHWGVPLITFGLQGWSSFTNSDNVHLGGQTGAANSDPYSHAGDPNAKGNNIAIGRIALNGSQGGGNVALGAKSFVDGKGDYNFLGNFAAGFKSTISDTIAVGYFAGAGSEGNKNVWLGASQAGGSKGNNTVLIGSNSTVMVILTMAWVMVLSLKAIRTPLLAHITKLKVTNLAPLV